MTREDALALLNAVHRDPNPPPPTEPEKMARLFVAVVSNDTAGGLTAARLIRRELRQAG
jgi:hypothetical protein